MKKQYILLISILSISSLPAKSLYNTFCDPGCLRSVETDIWTKKCNIHFGEGKYKEEVNKLIYDNYSKSITKIKSKDRKEMQKEIDIINEKYIEKFGKFE